MCVFVQGNMLVKAISAMFCVKQISPKFVRDRNYDYYVNSHVAPKNMTAWIAKDIVLTSYMLYIFPLLICELGLEQKSNITCCFDLSRHFTKR